jgi:hypothetical protein
MLEVVGPGTTSIPLSELSERVAGVEPSKPSIDLTVNFEFD